MSTTPIFDALVRETAQQPWAGDAYVAQLVASLPRRTSSLHSSEQPFRDSMLQRYKKYNERAAAVEVHTSAPVDRWRGIGPDYYSGIPVVSSPAFPPGQVLLVNERILRDVSGPLLEPGYMVAR